MLWFALEEVKKEGAIIRGKPGEQDHLSLIGSLLLALAQQMLTSIHAAASSLQYLENGSSVEAEGFHASRRVGCSIIAMSLGEIILIFGMNLLSYCHGPKKTYLR